MLRSTGTLVLRAALATGLAATALPASEPSEVSEAIDRHISARLERDGVRRVPAADDAEFLRRASLDLHGVVPSAERVAGFLDSDDPEKRSRLIDELLASRRFGEFFGDTWRGRLISPLENAQRARSDRFARWLSDHLNAGRWDRTVRELITVTGTIDENPAAIWLIEGRNPLPVTGLTDLTCRYFLGIRLNCAQCHDHPFAEWKQPDYWGMAAFFAQIQTPGRPKQVHMAGVKDDPRLTLAMLQSADAIDGFQPRSPTFLDGRELSARPGEPHRAALADWITSPENPFFARAAVNRMWWHFFGRGLVNPVDDMHSGNAPSHAELLDELSRDFVDSGYDLKRLCRAIVGSRTYQQTSRPGEQADSEGALFARMAIKTLTPEQLYDSLVEVLGPPAKSPGIDARLGARYEFTLFFAGDGDPDPIRYERGIPHLLRMMNSSQFAGPGVASLAGTAAAGRSDDEALDDLYLRILSRRPSTTDRALARRHLEAAGARQEAFRELAWALLMSSEFSLNH